MRRFVAIGAAWLTVGCAGLDSGTPAAAGASGVSDAVLEDLLSELSLRFTDPEDPFAEIYESSGPFEVVAVSAQRIELAGFDRRHLEPTRTILHLDGDRVWVTVQIGERSFASRIR